MKEFIKKKLDLSEDDWDGACATFLVGTVVIAGAVLTQVSSFEKGKARYFQIGSILLLFILIFINTCSLVKKLSENNQKPKTMKYRSEVAAAFTLFGLFFSLYKSGLDIDRSNIKVRVNSIMEIKSEIDKSSFCKSTKNCEGLNLLVQKSLISIMNDNQDKISANIVDLKGQISFSFADPANNFSREKYIGLADEALMDDGVKVFYFGVLIQAMIIIGAIIAIPRKIALAYIEKEK